MSRPAGLIVAALLSLAATSLSKTGEVQQQRQAAEGRYTFRVSVDSVLLNVSVRDRRTNRSVPGLRKEDFLIYDDGVLQEVEQLATSGAPFSALLLIDNSGSTRSFLPLVKQAATDFTLQLNLNDRIAVAVFNSLVELAQDFTDDRSRAAGAIGNISSMGGTALYDALMTCIDIYMRDMTERSAIVVFTDGVDNQLEGENTEGSRTPFSQLYRRIQEIDPLVYTIFLDAGDPGSAGPRAGARDPSPGIGWPLPRPRRRPAPGTARPASRPVYEKAREQLKTIADQTGGRMYTLTRPEALAGIYREIAEDLRVQYLLAYTPNNHRRDGLWHDVGVRVKNRSDAAVRTRRGYYALISRESAR